MLFHAGGVPFSTGKTNYDYKPISPHGEDNRIILRVEIEQVVTSAVIDTAASYAIVEPNVAQIIQPNPAASIGGATVMIRGIKFKGHLYRLNLTIPAVEGEGMLREVTAFVPDPGEEGWGDLPSFLGMPGCLEFMRFAVDPDTDSFYFG